MTSQKYKAFLSYSHRDKKWADWLHRNLESYKFPKNISPSPEPLKPIFRDREELSVSSDLSKRVQEALTNSDCLIVICSENSAKSEWVNKEILLFKSLKPTAEIFSVIISGEPHAEKSGLPAELECFPSALRFRQDKDNPKTTVEIEPLAADLRKNKDGKQLGLVKLIAGIVGIRPDELIQRDLQRARRRVTAITALSVSIVSVLSLLTISTLFARNAAQRNAIIAEQQRELAETRRDEAEGLIEFMLGDLRQELEPVGRLAILTDVADRALEYYSHSETELTHCKSASGAARAKYLHTHIAVDQGNFSKARQYSNEALSLLDAAAENCGDVRQFIVNHTHAMQWSADLDILELTSENTLQTPLKSDILDKYLEARDNLLTFEGEGSTEADFATEVSDAEILIGKYHTRMGEYTAALAHLRRAEAILEPHIQSRTAESYSRTSNQYAVLNKRADVLTWISGAFEGLSKYQEAFNTSSEARRLYVSLNQSNDGRKNWNNKFDIIGTDYALARLFFKQGHTEDAIHTLQNLKSDVMDLVSQDPSNDEWQELKDKILSSHAALKPKMPLNSNQRN